MVSPEKTLTDLNGCFPSYDAVLTSPGGTENRRVLGVVAAQAPALRAEFEALGLEPGERIVSLSDFSNTLAGLEPAQKGVSPSPLVVFLLGLARESRPLSTSQALNAASVLLDELGYRVAVLYGNLKVSGSGIEARVREARMKGALFLGFTGNRPVFTLDQQGRVTIECIDEAGRMPLILRPDWTVLDETLSAGPSALYRAGLLRAEPGPDGLLPSDNIYRHGIKTNRKGILAILPDADPLGRDSLEDDLAAAMLEIRALESLQGCSVDKAAVIDSSLCARCLTCFRSCPHGAVSIGERVEIVPEACFACGICEAACPGLAIALSSSHKATAPPAAPEIRPKDLVAFGCRRSAERARALCRHLGRELPKGLVFIQVDCAGSISCKMLMDAFLSDAAGVLVLACHPGNCHAERGNTDARARVEEVQGMLEEIGLDSKRLRFHTLAANTGVEFGRVVREFTGALVSRKDDDTPS